MAEIASKWDSYSDVQQSGIATALAGTRQRENVITMFENFDLVKKYEQISANSYGTAAQKMEAYTDSVEAARQRITTSVEKFVLSFQSSALLKEVYNVVADLTSNLAALSGAIVTFLLFFNTSSTKSGFLGGVNQVQQKLLNYNLYQSGNARQNTELYNKGLKNSLQESFLSGQKELFTKKLNNTIENLQGLGDESKTLLKDGMVPLQNSLLNLSTATKDNLTEVLRNTQASKTARLAIIQRSLQEAGLTAVEAALRLETEEAKRARFEEYMKAKGLAITEENLNKTMQDENARRAVAAEIIDESPDEINGQLRDNLRASRLTSGQAMAGSLGSLALTGVGGLIGAGARSLLGSGGTAIGTSVGALLGNLAGQRFIESMTRSITRYGTSGINAILARIQGIGLKIGGTLAVAAIFALYSAWKQHKENIKKELAEAASEAATVYSDALNSSAEAVNFDKLVQGVDYLGRNVSLTDEEYQKFLDSSNALAEAFPELVVRVDEFGNKLVGPDGLNGKVGQVSDSINGMLDDMRKTADIKMFKGKSGETAFSNTFDEQYKIIKEARKGLNNKIIDNQYHGVDEAVERYPEKIKAQEDLISSMKEDGIDTAYEEEVLSKMKQDYKDLIADQDSYNGQIREAGQALVENLDNLISYASTDTGSIDFDHMYDGLYDQIQALGDEANTMINQQMKLSFNKIDFTNEDELKSEFLRLSQEIADFIEANPIVTDIYFGEGEFKTIGEQQDATEQLIPSIVKIFGADGYDKAEKAIIEQFGLKVVIDGNKTSIESESLGETFSKGFEGEIGKELTQQWDDYIGTLNRDQYKKLNSLQKGGWINKGSVNNTDKLNAMLGANQYQTTDLQVLSKQYSRRKQELGGWTGDQAYDITNRMTTVWQNALKANPDEDMSNWLMDKTNIASNFATYGQDFMELFDAQQKQLAEDIKNKSPEEVNKACEEFNKQIKLEAGLQEEINALTPITQAVAEQLFSNIDVEGYIDTWSELKDAFDSIKNIYNDLADAQSEMNSQGHLQVQTVLDLLDSDENYIQALYVENEQIKLKSNAEEIMNEVKLRGVQISLQQSIAEKELEKAQLESQLRALYGKKVYTEAADDTVNATDNKITAFQAESDALADVTNSYLTLAQAELAANRAKLADNEGAIAAVQGTISNFKAADTIKSTQLKRVDRSKIIDYSAMSDDEYKAQKNYLERSLKAIAGEFKYDDKTGQFSYNMDKQGHYTEGVLGMKQHLEGIVTDIIKSGAKAGKTFGKVYDSLKGASKDAKDSVNDLLKALDSLIDKEWEAMKVWDEDKQESTGYTAYFKRKRESLAKLAAVAKSKMDSAATEEERADAEKDYIEYQKQINNLDDEEIEDKYNILELQGASLDKLIAMQKVYIQTSDTEEENLERNKKLVELLHQQVELHREVSEWQRDNTDRLLDRLSGDAYGNEAYDRAIGQQIEAVNDEMADTQKQIQMYYAEAVKGYEKSGSTHAEALRLAYTGNSDASQSLRDEMTKYYDLIDKRTEYTIKKMEDKADDLNRRLDLIEKEKPQEWFKIGDIDSYYTQRMDLLQKQVELYQDALKDTSDMTDEQIQNIVDSLNEATLNLKEAQIDNLKDQTDLQSKQYDAIVYRINLWKDEIQDAIDAIEKAYEDEIKPIQDVSDELERQAKLEDLLAAKKAAAKEKERVALNALYKNGYISQKPEMVETQERLKTIIFYFQRKEVKIWRVFIKLQQKILMKDSQKAIQDKQLSHLKNENISIIEMQQN